MRILIDMDGVIANFDKTVLEIYRNRYPDKPFIPLEQRTTFYVKEQYPPELQPLVEAIYLEKGFYSGLPPIEGALEALAELSKNGNDICICTSPMLKNQFCIQEKIEWVIRHLGKNWMENIIIIKDKTRVRGDILIDDRPDIKGVQEPVWEHVLYTQPYNANVDGKRRLTWQNWKDVLK